MPEYLGWTQGDLGAVERALKRYKTLGLEASSDIGRSGHGIVALSQIDPRVPDAPIVIFEIHKLKRSDSDLRTHWVVQIQSIDGKTQAFKQHGCVSASSATFALAKAEKDVQDGFVARDTFDMAANSYWLKL